MNVETSPFDTVARDYDATFTGTVLGRLLRERVWQILVDLGIWGFGDLEGLHSVHQITKYSNPQILEINCGTGKDAIWLAQRGWQVLATDISPEMAEAARQKVKAAGFENQVKIQVCSFAEISRFSGKQFDLVFSNFGGLNCASPEELQKLSLDLQKLIAPGGQFVAVVMSRFCWQETLYFLLKGKLCEAFRRLSRNPVNAHLNEKKMVPTWYHSPNEFRPYFPDFQVKKVAPVGFWLPPSYLNPFFEKRPRLLGFLNFLEKNCAPTWLAPAADHFFICLEKRATSNQQPVTMNVLFTHGYFLHEDPKEQVIMKPYPPLGLLYLSAWVEMHGVENEVFDTTFSTKEDLKKYLLEHRPRIVALYVNLMTKLNIIEIMRFIRSQETLKNSLIVLGGPDVTHNAEDYLVCGADLIVIGEGEQTMLEIAECGMRNAEFADSDSVFRNPHSVFETVPGLAFRLPDGSVFKTPPREKMRDIDQLPLPNRLKINLQLYLGAWKRAHGHSAVSISTQRGCPYTCRWCSTAVYGQSYRRRSPANVADEIVFLRQHYDFDLIWFVDDVFTVSHKWLNDFRDELQKREVKIQFECITRADRLNEEVIRVLKECGCFRVWIGAESGSQRIIDAMDRRVDVGQVREMIKVARREGIQAGTFIMLGYPGETEADIRETVAHLKDSNPDLFTITVAYPIKGTGLYEEVQASSFSGLPWGERTDRDLDFQRTYPRRYYDFAVRWTVNAVHLHKAKLEGKQFTFNGLKSFGKTWAARAGMRWWRGAGKI